MLRPRRCAAHRSRVERASRRGFSVVEVLVALIVVMVGLLGVAGTSAIALRASSAAIRERAAIARARSRLALLESAGCAGASGGERHLPGGLLDRWTVRPAENGVRLVDALAQWDDADGRRDVLLTSALLC